MMKRILFSVILAFGLTSACGGDGDPTPLEACQETGVLLCGYYYECLSEANRDLLNLPPTEEECVDDNDARCQLNNDLCPDDRWHGDAADECIDAYTGLSCSEAQDVANN
ncbi:MAG TPA: hypothetical protein VFG83_13890, partial [Kofleriaceae bacterium]|nr:hypothetical protein [Kofleriaceae bacterium]